MRILSVAAVVVLNVMGGILSPVQSAPAKAVPEAPQATHRATPQKTNAWDVPPEAMFKRDKPASAAMALSREGGGWRIALRAGGLPNGAATAADCELQAVGPQDAQDVIAARVVPFEGELNTMTAADVGANPPVVQVRVTPEGAFIQDKGAAARYCGMGSDISGFYRRSLTPD